MTIKDEAVREDILYEAPAPDNPKFRIVLVRGVGGFATVERNGDGIDRERREHGTNFLDAVRAFNERTSGADPSEPKPDSLAAEIREVAEGDRGAAARKAWETRRKNEARKAREEELAEALEQPMCFGEWEEEDETCKACSYRGTCAIKTREIEGGEPEEETEYEVYLENRNGAHLKFYEVKVDGIKVLRRWGRIGTEGRSKVERYLSREQAVSIARDLVQRKLKRGYSRA
jgi:predicted DNA-binding WGR domain protein